MIDEPQPTLYNLKLGGGVAADARQPAVSLRVIGDAVGRAEFIGAASSTIWRWDSPQQQHRDLGAEAGGESQGVFDLV